MKSYLWLSLSPQPHVHIYNESAEVAHIPAEAAYDYKDDVNITALLDSEASRFTSAQNGSGVLREMLVIYMDLPFFFFFFRSSSHSLASQSSESSVTLCSHH